MTSLRRIAPLFVTLFLASVLAACGGGGGDGEDDGGGNGNVSVAPRFACAANILDDTVLIYRVDAETGRLHDHGYVFAGDAPMEVAVDPQGRFAYTANAGSDTVTTFGIDQASGELSEVGAAVTAGAGPRSIAILAVFE